LSSRIELNKKYVLTKTKHAWDPPTIQLNNKFFDESLNKQLIKELKEIIFVNDLELLPQIVSIKQSDQSDTIDIIFGFIINYTESLSNSFWLEFDLLKEEPYSPILFEVIQTLN
jgi:hypothetical protein